LGRAIDAARLDHGGPLELIAAVGHGRSFGQESWVLGRKLPGILECGLWRALERDRRPGVGLVTDVGNDVAYGVSVPRILEWVRDAVDRLLEAGIRPAVARLPMASLRTIGAVRFAVFRRLFFPGCRLTLAEALTRAAEVDAGLVDLAAARGLGLVVPETDWYGMDPIHIRRRCERRAWRSMCSAWAAPPLVIEDRLAPPAPVRGTWRWRPERRWWFGVERRAAQPSRRLADGTTVALY
jgi:hypothetical protein